MCFRRVYAGYREHREYRPIKCCTKFAPKSQGHSTPIQLDKLEFDSSFNCFYGIITLGSYLLDKLEFDELNRR